MRRNYRVSDSNICHVWNIGIYLRVQSKQKATSCVKIEHISWNIVWNPKCTCIKYEKILPSTVITKPMPFVIGGPIFPNTVSNKSYSRIWSCYWIQIFYRGADKSLAPPTFWYILFDGENISFDASLVIYINGTNIPPIVIINRTHEHQNLLLL